MISRHPHVFGDASVADAEGVEVQWQTLKRKERSSEGTSIMDGIPGSLPSLATAQMLRDRAAGSGFDWEDIDGVVAKVREEVDEFKEARSHEEREAEMGDMLFTLVNISSWVGVDAEGALRASNNRFRRRFILMEQLAKERGLTFEKLTIEQKETLWQEAKKLTVT
jgi:tetrapyrrole methylase family protein/MazG family protein